ncbi:MAG: formate/nitrite transporter family protein [Oscillospiraceae bacterium]|nr:formate/nitrite transporter family protein [Oscillospiraceae bacterium]
MLKPADFVANYSKTGAVKSTAPTVKLLLLGIAAGFILACAGAAASNAAFSIPLASVAKLVSALIFPFGLIAIIYTGSELFTGNCLISISLLDGSARLSGMLRNLVIVYIGNFIGSAIVAAAVAYSGSETLIFYIMKAAATKCSLSFGKGLVLGFMCNVLVCLGVVCSLSTTTPSGRAMGAYIPVCLFVLCGFEHSIANMFYVPCALFALMLPEYQAIAHILPDAGIAVEHLTWLNFAVKNLVPVTIGNIIGGAGLGALLWYCHGKSVLNK